MRAFPLGQASATAAVLDLAGELAEHLRDTDDIAKFTLGLTASIEGTQRQRGCSSRCRTCSTVSRAASLCCRWCGRTRSARRRPRRWTSATSCAGRPSWPGTIPRSATAERDRFRVVLLDEYQDTSQAQVVLLRSLFGERATR